MEKIGKMHVSLVENRDLSGLQPRAQGQGPRVVVMGSFFNDGKAGKKTLQVQPQVHLRRGLAPTVLGPVHAVGHQGNGGGIDRMDRPFEATGQAAVAPGCPKPDESSCSCPSTFQNNASIMSLSRSLLACERVFRLGATAPLIALSLAA